MNIGSVAEQSGVPAKTIRYYEEIGLIPKALRAENGYRNYSDSDVETLRFVQRARKLGFSVKDVGNLLTLWRDKNRASADVKKFALDHIRDIESRIEELDSIRQTLVSLTNHCHGDERPDCPILEDLAGAFK
ncbi:MAG: Cu(I)-responsive transcriptional regulator [Rhodospirillaceae bacterium]|jgi:Cu(I)-responsive transcriptional regulator|nr:Cu(I)-responsive transcriptional regulator [Rhodospirillaceae bacterium]MBT4219429.1 Cu(I)-responsive transcriptional regulator [Rhodospirillaceae bacterium]MBT4463538.1 Cu(I)-responsive transcriptional regulator [Rhodospirillaceae bacterium]MBT5013407.1 Cu(I)-responsive transcriptional regulator [Rhodospirillaceae bacterium]MBT5308118.1 Cu(I)-responsive transcriptional regulator [Rhodospirillaceae bacterium]